MDINSLKLQAASTALTKILQAKHFSICDIDSIAKLMGCATGNEAYKILNTLHCVHYSDMPSELRQNIPNLIKMALGCELPSIQQEAQNFPEKKQENKSFIGLLRGGK